MQGSLPTVIGVVAGLLGTYSFLPQVWKCWRSGDTAAISLRMFLVRTFGLVLWTGYGFLVGSLPVLIFSAVGLLLSCAIVFLKMRGSRQEQAEARDDYPARSSRMAASRSNM